jgi:folate-binding protein YgfZ
MDEIRRDFHFWRPATWLHVAGPDAFSFLQGQFSNDLRALEGGGTVYGLWLNQKGRVLADSFVLKGAKPGAFWVGSYFSSAALVRERLESHLIADEVEIDDQTAHWHGMTIFGATGAVVADGHEVISFPGRRAASPATEWLATTEPARPGGRALTDAEMEEMRLAAGIPAVPRDLGPGDLPQEGGLETSAVSFTKGCYLGQEVMARLNSMGTPRRRLFRVKGPAPVISAGTALQQDGRVVGEMRSAVVTATGFIGLAMLQLAQVKKAGPLVTAENVALQVLGPV